MMRLHLGKRKGKESLRPLTEKDIQVKLYGFYHQDTLLKERIDSEFIDPLRKDLGGPSFRWKADLEIPWERARGAAGKLIEGATRQVEALAGRRVVVGLGVGTLCLALFLTIHALNLYRTAPLKVSKVSSTETETRELKEQTEITSPSPAPEAVSPLSKPPGPAAPQPPDRSGAPERPLEKSYVVQVCTYAKEEDASRLVDRMVDAGLPAFYEAIVRASRKTFYPVFLGRYPNYREAQGKLEEFRAHPLSREFPDIFVRSL